MKGAWHLFSSISQDAVHSEAQTNITAAGDSFYFLEAPETELEAMMSFNGGWKCMGLSLDRLPSGRSSRT